MTIDLTFDLEIKPDPDKTGVLPVLNFGGTVAFSSEVQDTISGIVVDYIVSLPEVFEDESGLVITIKPVSESYAVIYESLSAQMILK